MSDKLAIRIQNVSKHFGSLGHSKSKLAYRKPSHTAPNKAALKNINLEIQAGQKVAILGSSGAGKTTLLKICAGMLEPDPSHSTSLGENNPSSCGVWIYGNDLKALKRKEKSSHIGLMQQHFDLIPELKTIHNIQAGNLGRWNSWRAFVALAFPVETRSARDIARQLNIEELLFQRTKGLSGGEKQRVAFARLLVQDPKILLADEPVASLDPIRAKSLLDILANSPTKTCIVSLHLPALAKHFADRIIGMRQGQIAFDKPTDQLTKQDLMQLYELA